MRFSRWRVMAAIAALAVIACSTPEQRLAQHLEDGARLADDGHVDAAILEYRSALKLDPTSAEVNERLAIQLALADDKSAVHFFLDAFRLDDQRAEAGIKAVRLLITRDLTRARRLLRDVLQAAPEYAPAYIAKSDIDLVRGDSRSALTAALRATQLADDDAAAWFQLGKVHRARIVERQKRRRPYSGEEAELAIDAFTKADQLAGVSIRARVERARVIATLPAMRSRYRAQEEFKEAFELASQEEGFRGRLFVASIAVEFARSGSDLEFLDWSLRKLVDTTPDHLGAWRSLARLEDSRGRKGLLILEELIEKRPDDAAAHLIYTNHLIGQTKSSVALKHLRGLIDGGFDAPGFWEQITRIQIHRNKIANARSTYVKMLDSHPDHPVSRRTDARIAIAEGRFDAASKTLHALPKGGSNPTIQRLLALSELGRGDLPAASAAIERALPKEGDPSVELLRLKARIHYASREWEQVIEIYRSLRNSRVELLPAERIRQAASQYETGYRKQGRENLEALLDSDVPPPEAAAEYARRETLSDPQTVYRYLQQAHERAPTHFEVLERLTWTDIAAGRTSGAARLNSVIDSGRASAEIVLLRARVLAKLRNPEAAEQDALRALEADPTLDEAVELLFGIYRDRGSMELTQASFAEAEAAGVLHPGGQQLLGRIYSHNGELGLARESFEKAIAGNPEMLSARTDLATLLADSGRELDRAMELAEQVQQLRARDPKATDTLGYVYLRKGLHEAALQQFRFALELAEAEREGASPVQHYHLGLALLAMNRSDEASSAFERALAIDPDVTAAEEARNRLQAKPGPVPDAATPSPS